MKFFLTPLSIQVTIALQVPTGQITSMVGRGCFCGHLLDLDNQDDKMPIRIRKYMAWTVDADTFSTGHAFFILTGLVLAVLMLSRNQTVPIYVMYRYLIDCWMLDNHFWTGRVKLLYPACLVCPVCQQPERSRYRLTFQY